MVTTIATSDASTDSKQINVLTQDQEFILEAIKRLDNPHLQKTYLDRLLKDFNQPEHPPYNPSNRSQLPSTTTNTYDLTKILNKKKSPKPQSPFQNYILRSKPLNPNYKP